MCSLVWEEWDVVDARYLQNSLTVVQQAFEEEAAAPAMWIVCRAVLDGTLASCSPDPTLSPACRSGPRLPNRLSHLGSSALGLRDCISAR
jgi:hypothetical protein